jgi:hypothetical protein
MRTIKIRTWAVWAVCDAPTGGRQMVVNAKGLTFDEVRLDGLFPSRLHTSPLKARCARTQFALKLVLRATV